MQNFMNLDQLKPSHFLDQPMNSTLQNSESETVARNIMVIRKQLGNTWPLTWKKYKKARVEKGADFSEIERDYFVDVIKLIPDALGAIAFAPSWAAAARKVLSA